MGTQRSIPRWLVIAAVLAAFLGFYSWGLTGESSPEAPDPVTFLVAGAILTCLGMASRHRLPSPAPRPQQRDDKPDDGKKFKPEGPVYLNSFGKRDGDRDAETSPVQLDARSS